MRLWWLNLFLSLCFLMDFACSDKVVVEPKQTSINSEDTITLTCLLKKDGEPSSDGDYGDDEDDDDEEEDDDEDEDDDDDDAQVTWLFSGKEIKNERITIQVFSKREVLLTLSGALRSDAGEYKCVSKASESSAVAVVTVNEPIRFEDIIDEHHPLDGKPYLIGCTVVATPKAVVSWKHNGTLIKKKSEYKKTATGLEIPTISSQHNGLYECIGHVRKTGEIQSRNITLDVDYAPKIISKSNDLQVNFSDDVTFGCLAFAKPAPVYSFFKGDKELVNSPRIQINGNKATIQNVSVEDIDSYSCVAKNQHGSDTAKVHVNIRVDAKIIDLKAEGFILGQSGIIRCVAIGYEIPAMTLYKKEKLKGFVKLEGKSRDISLTERESVLEFHDVTYDDDAEFKCSVNNNWADESKVIQSEVGTVPLPHGPSLEPVYKWPHKALQLNCTATSKTQCNIRWSRKMVNLDDGDEKHDGDGVEKIGGDYDDDEQHYKSRVNGFGVCSRSYVVEDDDIGNYTCTVTNNKGSIDVTYPLYIAEQPRALLNMTVVNITATQVDLVIEEELQHGLPVTDVLVLLRPLGLKPIERNISKTRANDLKYNLNVLHLNDSTEYKIEVRPINLFGPGPESHGNFKTKDLSRPDTVKIEKIKSACLPPSEVSVKWAVPESSQLPILKYQLRYRKVTTPRNTSTTPNTTEPWIVKETKDTKYLLTDLDESHRYELFINAFNRIGGSNDNEPFVFHTCRDDAVAVIGKTVNETPNAASPNTGILLGIMIGIVVLVCVVVDVVCCIFDKCGVTKAIYEATCKKSRKHSQSYDVKEKQRLNEEKPTAV